MWRMLLTNSRFAKHSRRIYVRNCPSSSNVLLIRGCYASKRVASVQPRNSAASILERTCIEMIDTHATTIESPPEQLAVQSKNDWPPLWRRLALAVVMLVSIFMNFYPLGQNGFGNLYYAAAIRSMLDSWHCV
jgi:hypothetical protein